MGSMTKVMQKIREDGAESAEAPPAEASADASPSSADASPSSADGSQTQPVMDASPDSPSSFVEDASSTEQAFSPGDVDESQAPPTVSEQGTGPDVLPEEPAAAPEADRSQIAPGVVGTLADDRTTAWDPKRVDPVVVAFHDRYSAICEQYRSVRARLLAMNSTRTHQVIALTSSVPEEGKSVSTINLGLALAEGGEHRILIVDADFRRTLIARMLGVPSKPGLAEVLRGDVDPREAVQATPLPNLKLIPAGEVRDNAYGDLLGRASTAGVLDRFRTEFDYTFLDTPPVTTVSDVCLLAPGCDGVIMIVEMHRTPEPTVQQAVRTLQANNVKVLGCMLSRFRDRGARYYDYHYSDYYKR